MTGRWRRAELAVVVVVVWIYLRLGAGTYTLTIHSSYEPSAHLAGRRKPMLTVSALIWTWWAKGNNGQCAPFA